MEQVTYPKSELEKGMDKIAAEKLEILSLLIEDATLRDCVLQNIRSSFAEGYMLGKYST